MSVKAYIVIAMILIVAGMGITIHIQTKQLKKLNERADRLEQNQTELLSNSQNYLIRADLREFKQIITPLIDSILDELKVRPKNVERIVERYHYHSDTIIRVHEPEPIEKAGKRIYPFLDTTQCFTFGGHIELRKPDETIMGLQALVPEMKPVLEVNRREYHNKAIDVYYKRRKHKFWFIRWGEWIYERHTQNTCGDDEIREIEVQQR